MTDIIRNTYECSGMPNVLLVGAECAPLAKTGGLADVIGTLPKSLAKIGMDARVIMPYHKKVKDKFGGSVSFDEIGLPVKSTGMTLPCGSTAIWQQRD